MLNPPSNPNPREHVAVVGGNVEISQRIVDLVLGALGVAAASQGTMNNFAFGNNQFGYYETICGGTGAGPDFDGTDAVHSHMTNTRLTDIEILEKFYPVQVQRFQIRSGSGGAGRHCGGNGVIREIRFLAPLEVSLLTQRRTIAPFGLKGGNGGESGKNIIQRRGATNEEILSPLAQVTVDEGDVIKIITPGGGGYGQP
jgi:5-oxoprolinase (ATP-hydrolysing)